MWNDRLRIAERVEDDWKRLDAGQRDTARKALETIDEDPIIGAPLFDPFRGWWSYRSGELRVIYRIVAEARFVVILSVQMIEVRGSSEREEVRK